jgi:hypothetical protein
VTALVELTEFDGIPDAEVELELGAVDVVLSTTVLDSMALDVVLITAVLDSTTLEVELSIDDDVELAQTDEESCAMAVETPAEGMTVTSELENIEELGIETDEVVLEAKATDELDDELAMTMAEEEPGMTPLE